MNIVVAERSATERELALEIPGEKLSTLVEGKLDSVRKRIQLPGFRAGKVPKDLVRKRFGESIRAEAIEELVNQSLREAFKEKKVNPVAPGVVEELEAPEGGDIKVKALVEVDAEIELEGYQDLGISIEATAVTDEQLQTQLESIRQRLAEVKKAERPSETGDLVMARYTKVFVDGVETPAPVPVFQAELGKGIPAVDQALTGVVAGQELVIDFTFPADHPDAAQAGKSARYEVTVENVYFRILPEFTDEFATKLGPFANLEEFKARVRSDMEEEARQEARRAAHEQAVEAVLSRNPFPVPKARVSAFIEWQHDRYLKQNNGQGPSLQEFQTMLGAEAEKAVRRQRAIEWILEKEGLKATTEEVAERIRALAAQAGISEEAAREELRKTGRLMEIRESLRFEKTLDWLVGVR
ncbi:MAG: trigger factor [Fibrobacteria bacterium]|nr:trigger factor [Fibrobacteria bacterium]